MKTGDISYRAAAGVEDYSGEVCSPSVCKIHQRLTDERAGAQTELENMTPVFPG